MSPRVTTASLFIGDSKWASFIKSDARVNNTCIDANLAEVDIQVVGGLVTADSAELFPIMPFSTNLHSGHVNSKATFCLMPFERFFWIELSGAESQQFFFICVYVCREEAGPFTSFHLLLANAACHCVFLFFYFLLLSHIPHNKVLC